MTGTGEDALFVTLLTAALSIGAVHTAAPDHWAPFAAASRARGWSAARTARITAICGTGHVTVSVLLGAAGLLVGLEALVVLGESMAAFAGWLLIAFGLVWAAWGLGHPARAALHGHAGPMRHSHRPSHHHPHPHPHSDPHPHVHDPSRLTALSLFLFFAADPCVAVIPLMFASAPLGPLRTAAVVLAYEAATVGTMLAFVLPARAGANALRFAWIDRWTDAFAGASVAAVGTAVLVIGV